MTQPNFTPGPYCDNGDGSIRQAEQNEGYRLFVAQVIDVPFNFGGDKVTKANINLLKAAPDMYAALEAALWCMKVTRNALLEAGWSDIPTLNAVISTTATALAKAGRR